MGTLKTMGDRVLRRFRDTGKNIYSENDIMDAANEAIDLIHAELVAIESNLIYTHTTITTADGTREYTLASGTWIVVAQDGVWIEDNIKYLVQVSEAARAGLGYTDTEHDLTGSYSFTASGSGSNEYYVTTSGGDNPEFDQPSYVTKDGSVLTEGTIGSLNDHEWAYGDNDSLGYSTVYYRDNSGDPDGLSVDISAFIPGTGEPDYFYITEDPKIGFIDTPDDTYTIHVYYYLPSTSFQVSTYDDDALPFEGIWNQAIEQYVLVSLRDIEERPTNIRFGTAEVAWDQAMAVTYARGIRRRRIMHDMFEVDGV